jgi:hypothetical protein
MLMYQCNACAHKECDHFISLGEVHVRCKKCGASYSFEEETILCIDWYSYYSEDDLNYIWKRISTLSGRGELHKQQLWQMTKRRIQTADRLDKILNEIESRGLIRLDKEGSGNGTPRKELIFMNGERLLKV